MAVFMCAVRGKPGLARSAPMVIMLMASPLVLDAVCGNFAAILGMGRDLSLAGPHMIVSVPSNSIEIFLCKLP